MGILRQIGEYLFIVKRDPNEEVPQWTKYMHRINRLSIYLFIIAIVIVAVKLIRHSGS